MQGATSTFDLVERVKRGDREAFSPLFEKYRSRLAVLIFFKTSPELRASVEIDDLLQETFLRAFRDVGQFTYQFPGSFMSWLSRIADHVVHDQARYFGRQQRRAAEMVPFRSESHPEGVEPADSRTPSRLLRNDEELRLLFQRLDALPEDYRRVILLAKFEELSSEEIARALGKSREAVALLLHRGLKRLRAAGGLSV